MGCFSTCFAKSKRHRRNRNPPVKASPSLLDHLQKYESVDDFKVPHLIEEEEEEEEENTETPIEALPESNDEKREKGSVSERKKVTFDLNVKIYDHLPTEEDEEEEEEALVNADLVEIHGGEQKAESKKEETVSDSSSILSYPLNHRYQNCVDNDDEFDEMLSSDESEIEYYTDDEGCEENANSPNDSKSNENRFDRSKYVNCVLTPVENVAQWKVVKAKSKRVASKKEDWELKENFEKADVDIGVDTSLSSWLKEGSANTVSVAPNKFEDRPILGALTLEEIRQFSAPSSPKKSSGFSPDDKPIIGSVGSYWSHSGTSTKSESSIKSKSRFGEDAKVVWDSTPFETRLEKALEAKV